MALYSVCVFSECTCYVALTLAQMVVMRWSPADALHPVAGLELVSALFGYLRFFRDLTRRSFSNLFETQVTLEQTIIFPYKTFFSVPGEPSISAY